MNRPRHSLPECRLAWRKRAQAPHLLTPSAMSCSEIEMSKSLHRSCADASVSLPRSSQSQAPGAACHMAAHAIQQAPRLQSTPRCSHLIRSKRLAKLSRLNPVKVRDRRPQADFTVINCPECRSREIADVLHTVQPSFRVRRKPQCWASLLRTLPAAARPNQQSFICLAWVRERQHNQLGRPVSCPCEYRANPIAG